jgi:hypothetical protein
MQAGVRLVKPTSALPVVPITGPVYMRVTETGEVRNMLGLPNGCRFRQRKLARGAHAP